MYALQEYRWERDQDGFITIFGRVERQNPTTGLWEIIADFTKNGIAYPEILETIPQSDQDDDINATAPIVLMRLAGVK